MQCDQFVDVGIREDEVTVGSLQHQISPEPYDDSDSSEAMPEEPEQPPSGDSVKTDLKALKYVRYPTLQSA